MSTYGYCRVSTQHQRITRQITNISEIYPSAKIIKEFYTGTRQDRPNWTSLINQIKKGDTIVFDSVSRMSRNAAEGFKDYKTLYEIISCKKFSFFINSIILNDNSKMLLTMMLADEGSPLSKSNTAL